MEKYEPLAREILSHVGGAENVQDVFHCITRLRFHLKDESLADTDYLKNLEGIITVVQSGGQYQVVIGNHVPDVYETVLNVGHLQSGPAAGQNEPEETGNLLNRLIDLISGIFQPILGIMCAAGMIKGLLTVLTSLGWLGADTGTAQILNAIGDALFMFLPVFLGYTSAQKFRLKPLVGILIGLILCYPAIQLSTVDAAAKPLYVLFSGTPFESPVYQTFLGIPFIAMDYTSTVVPVIFVTYLASKVEKWLNTFMPALIKSFMTPMITLLVSMVFGFLLIGPVATFLSNLISEGLSAVYQFSPILEGLIIGSFWQVMVIFGLHWGMIPIYINNLVTLGYDQIMMPMFCTTFVTCAVVLAVYFRTTSKKTKSLCLPALISGIFGVTEPAIYGIVLPLKIPFYISCACAGLGGVWLAGMGFREYTMAGLGVFEFAGLMNPNGSARDVIIGATGVLGASLLAFVITFFFWKGNKGNQEQETAPETPAAAAAGSADFEICAPLTGTLLPLASVKDEVFASGAMGDGIAIEPADGNVYAPADGILTVVFPTGHAFGLKSSDGAEILVHIGMDTVSLNGRGFDVKKKQGDAVRKGDLIVTFDKELLEKEGYCITTPVIVTNPADFASVHHSRQTTVNAGDVILEGEKKDAQ